MSNMFKLLIFLLVLSTLAQLKAETGPVAEPAKVDIKSQVLPLPENDTFMLDFTSYANLPLNPQNSDLRVFSTLRTLPEMFNPSGLKVKLDRKRNIFIGLWRHISAEEARQRRAEVAQDNFKMRSVYQELPESMTIPVGCKYASLSFLHTVKGGGDPGDELFQYTILYANGRTMTIPVREGERISGTMRPIKIRSGEMVYSSPVGKLPVNLFISSWNNPLPEQAIKSITISVKAKQVIPVILGIGGHKKWLGQKSASDGNSGKAILKADFGQHIKLVANGLFGMNNPRALWHNQAKTVYQSPDALEYKLFREIKFPSTRLWNRLHPEKAESVIDYKLLDVYAGISQKLTSNSQTGILLNLYAGLPQWIRESSNPNEHIEFFCSWYVNIVDFLVNHKQLPVTHLELFNEKFLDLKEDHRLKYRYYNAVAAALKRNFPAIRVGGMAECWPGVEVYEQFIVNCGKNTDFLSWHMYTTGKATTPTDELMRQTMSFSDSSLALQQIWNKHFPARKLEQAITEYNMNWAAWKTPQEFRQGKGIGAVWLLSVLKHLLYDSAVQYAYYWHFYAGQDYGVIDKNCNKRAPWTTFLLLNKFLSGGVLCQSQSNNHQVEMIAADHQNHRFVAVMNKSNQRVEVSLKLLNVKPETLQAEKYSIANLETTYHQSAVVLSRNNTLVLDNYATSIFIIEKIK